MNPFKIGVLLANLGTPERPTVQAVKRYLKQFLSDPRVIDLPPLKWQLILNGMILPKRSPKVAELYKAIWTKEGSPLLAISKAQQQAIQAHFDTQHRNVVVELGMSYGSPSIESATDRLIKAGVDKIIILPLYPQYSSTTTASVFDAFARGLTQQRKIVPFEFIHNYHDHPLYIQALANTISLAEDEKLLFSFHGIPERYQTEGDFYADHCRKTAQLATERAEVAREQWLVAFQSRFGDEEWLRPYTDETLEKLPAQGVKKVVVICPGFAADCLETLEEIAQENKENFLKAGGERYRYIPALNDNADHIAALVKLIEARM